MLLTLGSCDSDLKSTRDPRQLSLYPKKLVEYERLLTAMSTMFNEQTSNIEQFPSLRLTLVKVILRFLALNINYCKAYNK